MKEKITYAEFEAEFNRYKNNFMLKGMESMFDTPIVETHLVALYAHLYGLMDEQYVVYISSIYDRVKNTNINLFDFLSQTWAEMILNDTNEDIIDVADSDVMLKFLEQICNMIETDELALRMAKLKNNFKTFVENANSDDVDLIDKLGNLSDEIPENIYDELMNNKSLFEEVESTVISLIPYYKESILDELENLIINCEENEVKWGYCDGLYNCDKIYLEAIDIVYGNRKNK